MCEISLHKNCTDVPTVLNTTNFMNETFGNEKLTNKIEVIAHSAQPKFRNLNNLISPSNRNLSDSPPLTVPENQTSALITSSNVMINSLLPELLTVENMTQNNASESENIFMDDFSKMVEVIAASKITRELDPEFETNDSDVNCINHWFRLPDSDGVSPIKSVILAPLSVKSDFRKLLEIVRDASIALLQSVHMTTSGNITLFGDNLTLVDSDAGNSTSAFDDGIILRSYR
uniref:Uncharacterized protein n=1 Tax=Elaeophora elaphi TaxID=1147741 RepID=A0A0R3RFE1_9BILA